MACKMEGLRFDKETRQWVPERPKPPELEHYTDDGLFVPNNELAYFKHHWFRWRIKNWFRKLLHIPTNKEFLGDLVVSELEDDCAS